MKIKKIILNNIRSYERQDVIFPEGPTLLSGDIGAGKTSVLLAIEFSLFGLQPGQRGSSLLKNGEKTGGVIMEFEIDGKEIIIERNLKRGKAISQDYCSITINGQKSEISVMELKSRVLELLEYPKEFSKKQNFLYKFTVYTPQEEMKQIILEDPETRINTLRHVFGIDKYKKILENTSIITSKIREEKRVKEGMTLNLENDKADFILKENDLETKQHNLFSVEKELFLKTESRKKLQEEKEELLKKTEEKLKFRQEIEKTNLSIINKNDSISSNKKLIDQLENQVKELQKMEFDESKIQQLENEILEKKNEKTKQDEKMLEINSNITSINRRNEDIKKLEIKLSDLEKCPTCLQDVDALYRANVLNKLHSETAENNKSLESFQQEKNEVHVKIKQFESEVSLNEKQISDLKIVKIKLEGISEKKTRIDEISRLNISLGKDMDILKQHAEAMKNSVVELEKFDILYNMKQKEFEEAMRLERLAEIKVAELRKEIDVFSNQIEELKERVKRIEEIKKQLNYISSLEDWLSNKFVPFISFIEKNVMLKLKADFSRLFNEWFSMLVSDSFHIRLDDDFTPIIEQQDYELDYSYLSGGERTAVALAYRLSLNQVINSLLTKIKTKDIVILDEPTDGFSDQQLDKMRDVLHQLNVKQLIIVSHEQKIESFVENVIKFKKENGISVIEE